MRVGVRERERGGRASEVRVCVRREHDADSFTIAAGRKWRKMKKKKKKKNVAYGLLERSSYSAQHRKCQFDVGKGCQ